MRPPADERAPARPAGGAERLGLALFAVLIGISSFVFVEPAPYDLLILLLIPLWLAIGLRLHRSAMVLVVIMLAWKLGNFTSLLPYFDSTAHLVWSSLSFYLMVTAFFFTAFFSDDTLRRFEIAMKAFVFTAVVTSLIGIAGYFDLGGSGSLFTLYGRASGTFKDPNVFGSFLPVGALYLMRRLLTGEARRPALSLVALAIIAAGIFFSFSRGSWAGTVIATLLMIFATFATARTFALRRRIVTVGAVACLGLSAVLAGLLNVPAVQRTFADRVQLTQDYDEGATGRFGNQLRSIPLLLDEPNGFGPLRFRALFGQEPHNTYIGTFANGGWIAGFAWLALVAATTFIGFRLCFSPSPFQGAAQVAWPALMMYFLQAAQIDVDHWRNLYFLCGIVWGLEAARQSWAWRFGSRNAVIGVVPGAAYPAFSRLRAG